MAESVEENARLKRELEAERIKTAAGRRRLEDAVERQDAALAEIRRDSGHLRDQRDRQSFTNAYTPLILYRHSLVTLRHGVLYGS